MREHLQRINRRVASAIRFVPYGGITSITVQSAIQDVIDSLATENLWDRTSTTVTLHNSGDTLNLSGAFQVNTNKFTVANATGDTLIAGTLGVTGQISGNLTGNVTGNASGSSGSCTGNAATVTNGFYTTSSFYLGTTSIAVNRASASLALTGITSIDGSSASCTGNAATVTNGFYTTSSFYLGTTSIAVNRSSAAQVLTGITSIDGSSASCTGNSATASKSTNIIGGNNTTLLGSIPYQSNTDVTTLLAPNVTTSKKYLCMTGNGTNGAAPSWDTLKSSDGTSGLASGTVTYAKTWDSSGTITIKDGLIVSVS